MAILFFDTETTGKAQHKKASSDPSQPDLVQLGLVLADQSLREVASCNLIVYPEDWEVPEEAANIHGINTALARDVGIQLSTAITLFTDLADAADRFVAHNAEYDVLVIERARARLKRTHNPFAGKEVRCTMKAAKPLLKLPNRNPYINDPYKFPKLEECYRHFFDQELEDAHDALVDVRATIRVYGALCGHYGMIP